MPTAPVRSATLLFVIWALCFASATLAHLDRAEPAWQAQVERLAPTAPGFQG